MNARQQYREEVWAFMIHGSGTSLKESATVWVYLDESGGLDTKTAVLGGMLINYRHFNRFESNWLDILERHHIPWPLHMKNFAKDGPLGYVTPACRFELFSELSHLINENKIYSITAKVRSADFKANVDEVLQRSFGIYGMTFLMAVVMNTGLSKHNKYTGNIPFVLDGGNSKTHHIVQAHNEIRQMQREDPTLNWHVAGLHFEDDRDFALVQAADVIAWASRRKEDTLGLPKGMEPLNRILDFDRAHADKYFEAELMKQTSDQIMTAHNKRLAEQNEPKEYE